MHLRHTFKTCFMFRKKEKENISIGTDTQLSPIAITTKILSIRI